LSFLSAEGGKRLIIPILLFDRDRIDRYFSNDELWTEIQRLQWMDASALRSEQPGSQTWIAKTTEIAERVETALEEQHARGAAAALLDLQPASDTGDDAESTEGYLDKIALAEDLMPNMTPLAESYSNLITQFGEVTSTAAARLDKTTTFGQRLAVAHDLASSLRPISDEALRVAQDMRSTVSTLSPGIVTIIRMAKNPAEENDSHVIEFIESIDYMAKSALEAFDHLDELSRNIHEAKGISAELDRPLKKIQASLLLFAETRSTYKSWREEVNRQPHEAVTAAIAGPQTVPKRSGSGSSP
jgi:hypothetical protein